MVSAYDKFRCHPIIRQNVGIKSVRRVLNAPQRMGLRIMANFFDERCPFFEVEYVLPSRTAAFKASTEETHHVEQTTVHPIHAQRSEHI